MKRPALLLMVIAACGGIPDEPIRNVDITCPNAAPHDAGKDAQSPSCAQFIETDYGK